MCHFVTKCSLRKCTVTYQFYDIFEHISKDTPFWQNMNIFNLDSHTTLNKIAYRLPTTNIQSSVHSVDYEEMLVSKDTFINLLISFCSEQSDLNDEHDFMVFHKYSDECTFGLIGSVCKVSGKFY